MNLIFIGQEFYVKSGSIMSEIYEISKDGLLRSDWGNIQIALMEGEEVHIRQANQEELKLAYLKLGEIIANQT